MKMSKQETVKLQANPSDSRKVFRKVLSAVADQIMSSQYVSQRICKYI